MFDLGEVNEECCGRDAITSDERCEPLNQRLIGELSDRVRIRHGILERGLVDHNCIAPNPCRLTAPCKAQSGVMRSVLVRGAEARYMGSLGRNMLRADMAKEMTAPCVTKVVKGKILSLMTTTERRYFSNNSSA